MNVFFDTIGCRLNQSEIERMAHEFRTAGHSITGNLAEADLVIINSCSVTSSAASDSRQKIRQASHVAPQAQIVATGCWASLEPAEAASLVENIRVIGNTEKDNIPATVLGLDIVQGAAMISGRESLPGARHRTRAFIKVQDGCDAFCTFCVTRLARGKSRSEPINRVLTDIRSAIAGGAKEIVLCGVQLGSWGRHMDPVRRLQDLVATILQETNIQRVRFSSIEPWDIQPDFFDLFNDRRICRHLHIAVQSGSAATIKRMGRRTTPAEFSRILENARQVDPLFSLSTDVITGFPGETAEEFEESLAFVQQAGFSSGHVFPYSARKGTPAADLPDQVPVNERRNRAARMRGALAQTAKAYCHKLIGMKDYVLWETAQPVANGFRLNGLNGGFIRVTTISPSRLINTITQVRFTNLTDTGMEGEILPNI